MDGWETLFSSAMVDRRNPAPVDMVNIPLFTRFYHHPQWLFGISEPSTVYRTEVLWLLNVNHIYAVFQPLHLNFRCKNVRFREGIRLPFKAGMIVALALLGTAFSFREVHGDEVGRTTFPAEKAL